MKKSKCTVLLALLMPLCACSNSPLAAALDIRSPLVPGSKGEQLNPTSKGEYKFSQLAGHIHLPRTISDFNAIELKADGQTIPPEQRVLAPTDNPQAVYFRVTGITPGQNIVVDVNYQGLQLSTMFPEAKAATVHTHNVDATSTVAVAVARKADSDGIRALKAWSQPELAQLLSLPELEESAQTLIAAYRDDQENALGSSAVQAHIQTTLQAFLARLQTPNP